MKLFLLHLSVVAYILCACQQGRSAVTFEVSGDTRRITSDGLPNHPTGAFPGPENPNSISAQQYAFQMPMNPKIADTTTALSMSPFGLALNGIVFDPFAAEWWNGDQESGWQLEPMSGLTHSLGIDHYNAHVQPTGAYHYHGLPVGLIEHHKGTTVPLLLGYAADGFPIYAPLGFASDGGTSLPKILRSRYRVKKGTRPDGPGGTFDGRYTRDYEYVVGAGDLDECNGRFGVTPEYPAGTYYYVITDQYPFIPRCFKGTPDSSFIRRGPGGNARPGGPGRRPPGGPGGPQRPERPPDRGRPPRLSEAHRSSPTRSQETFKAVAAARQARPDRNEEPGQPVRQNQAGERQHP